MTRPPSRLHVVGAGLVGGSIARAAALSGWSVTVQDADVGRAEQLRQVLGPQPVGDRPPDLVCVAVPPPAIALCVNQALRQYMESTVMDVGSVKARPLADVEELTGDVSRFVPSHPLAGSELAGPAGARTGLFRGRTWVVCPDRSRAAALLRAETLIRDCGATPVRMSASAHDRLVAVTSHLPQLLASALAAAVDRTFAPPPASARPVEDDPPDPSLVAGPALIDMTRIAASPAEMWAEIAVANRVELRTAVGQMLASLHDLDGALDDPTRTRSFVTTLVETGARGRARISPKHRSAPPPAQPRLGAADPEASWVWVDAVVDDAPGALARLFQTADALQINIEDLHVDHAPHAATGVVSMAVRAQHAESLRAALAPSERSTGD